MSSKITRREFMKGTAAAAAAAAAGMSGPGLLLRGDSSKKEFDLLIKGALIYDGSGRPGFEADIGIKGEIISAVGPIPEGQSAAVVEAKGLAVSPGFIDMHAHTDVELLVNPKAESSIHQGITTIVSGNCGSSGGTIPSQVYDETAANLKEVYNLELTWRDIKGFMSRLEQRGAALNYSTLVGHGDIRGSAMGYGDRPPSAEELDKMRDLVRQNLLDGAVGLSSGLEYTPGSFARPAELSALCRVVAGKGGVYATHMRDEGDRLLESLDESIGVARESGVSLEISHFKVAREGTNADFLKRLQDSSLEPKLREHLAEAEKKLGSWDKVVISDVVSAKNKFAEGKNILAAAAAAGKEPYIFMRDVLIEEKGRVGIVIFMMKEENLKRILAHPLVSVGTDGSSLAPYGPLGLGKPHPRHYGTFPRVLGKYIRQEKILPWETMIRKMTSVAAEKFHFAKRGLVKKGCFADLVVFNPETVLDKATWVEPHRYPVGIEYVLVNGQVVVERGEHTGRLPGKILKPLAAGS
jgi:N-acyl-D-amino-acid deacylase